MESTDLVHKSDSAKLPHDKDRFRLLVEAIEVIRDYAIFLLDPNGVVLTWNLGAKRIKGYLASEIIGKHFSAFSTIADLNRNHPQEVLDHARAEGRYEEEGWRIRKDGTKFWASIVVTRLDDEHGNLLGFSKVTRDLSERRKADEALRQSEERFRMLVEGVKDYAIFLLDPNGRIVSWNAGAEKLKGYRADEIIGQTLHKFYSPEEVASGKCEYELQEAAVTGRFEDEGWRIRKDGTKFWASVIITALRNPERKLLGFSKITRDLTERKHSEDKIRLSNDALERRVKERTLELSHAKADLERALESRDEFLSIASHELKTPLTSLRLQVELLRAKFDPASSAPPPVEKVRTTLSTVLRQTDRLTALIEDLLDVSRVHLGKLGFTFESTDLSKLVKDMVERWGDALSAVQCKIATALEPDVVAVVDSYRIEQVLTNLFSNIIKYAPGEPVNVTVMAESQYAVIKIKDGGQGIEPEQQTKIFDRYERGANHDGVTGLGLGLYICRGIIEAHGGTITVRSTPGNGSMFVLRIPLTMDSGTNAQGPKRI